MLENLVHSVFGADDTVFWKFANDSFVNIKFRGYSATSSIVLISMAIRLYSVIVLTFTNDGKLDK